MATIKDVFELALTEAEEAIERIKQTPGLTDDEKQKRIDECEAQVKFSKEMIGKE